MAFQQNNLKQVKICSKINTVIVSRNTTFTIRNRFVWNRVETQLKPHVFYPDSCGRGLRTFWRAVLKWCGFRVSGLGFGFRWAGSLVSCGRKVEWRKKRHAVSKISGFVWTRPKTRLLWLKAVALSPPVPPPGKKKGRRNLCSCGKKAWTNKLAGELGAGNT